MGGGGGGGGDMPEIAFSFAHSICAFSFAHDIYAMYM